MPAILKTFTWTEAQNSTLEGTILKPHLVVRPFFVMLFSLAQNWREGEKPVTDFAIPAQGQRNVLSKQLPTSLSSLLIIFGVWSMFGSK